MNNGKGDIPRAVIKKIFDENFDQIIWKPKPELEQIKRVKTLKGLAKRFVYK